MPNIATCNQLKKVKIENSSFSIVFEIGYVFYTCSTPQFILAIFQVLSVHTAHTAVSNLVYLKL